MRFRLTYRGQLRPRKSVKLVDIHEIRSNLHPQVKQLWNIDPLSQFNEGFHRLRTETTLDRAGMKFRPIICRRLALIAHIDVLFLRPQPPGAIIGKGGDIDNRLKTLFDALRVPSASEVEKGKLQIPPGEAEMHCLLEDDSLLTKVAFESDRLLGAHDENDAILILQVTVGRSKALAINDVLASF